MTFDAAAIRADFPIFEREINGFPLVYLDSGNTSQKPRHVIDTVREHYERHNGNVARSVHTLGTEATLAYEGARAKVAAFIGAATEEVVFTKNSTEAINLVAHAFSERAADPRFRLGPGDEIVISEMEHHSNIVPWQLLCERTGATLRWFGLTDDGRLDLTYADELITDRTKLVSVVHYSNILGTINPVALLAQRAHAVGALMLVDGSQSVPHFPVSVADLGADFLAFTSHKMCGPTGAGVLWGRSGLLEAMPPFLGGGSMIETVTLAGSTYLPPPARFEAGTPPIAEVVGLGAAVDYLTGVGMAAIAEHEQQITAYTLEALATVPDVRVIGPADLVDRAGTISLTVEGVHPHDVGQILDAEGVEVRVGHHCARPVCVRYEVPATTRVSPYLYTTTGDIDALIRGLYTVRKVFA
jgi:cysteine desulfurase / selenocysteine lyase